MTTDDGVAAICSHIYASWTWIGLYDETHEITRLHAPSDDRVTWEKQPNTNDVVATITVRGKDADIISPDSTAPTTITATRAYDSATTSTALATDSDTDVTIEADNDQAIITHTLSLTQ